MARGNTPMMAQRSRVREASNPLDYKKVIVDRSVEPVKFWKPRDPRMAYPRMRAFVASANR